MGDAKTWAPGRHTQGSPREARQGPEQRTHKPGNPDGRQRARKPGEGRLSLRASEGARPADSWISDFWPPGTVREWISVILRHPVCHTSLPATQSGAAATLCSALQASTARGEVAPERRRLRALKRPACSPACCVRHPRTCVELGIPPGAREKVCISRCPDTWTGHPPSDILEDVKASGIYREHTRYTCVHRLCAPPPRRVGGRRGATAHRAASVLTQLPACVHGQVSTSGGSGRALTPQKPRKHVCNEEGTRGGHGLPPWQAHGI